VIKRWLFWVLVADLALDFFADLDENEHQDKESDGRDDVGSIEHGGCWLVLVGSLVGENSFLEDKL
jgi:hypothetical protein